MLLGVPWGMLVLPWLHWAHLRVSWGPWGSLVSLGYTGVFGGPLGFFGSMNGSMVRSTLLQVSIGRQAAPRGVPPVDAPGPPLDLNISGSRSPNETSRVWALIVFDALSDGINAISPS